LKVLFLQAITAGNAQLQNWCRPY